MSKKVVRYSEAFRMQVISELESGALDSIAAARSRYGIPGGNTIQYWLKKYGKNHLNSKVIKVETPKERDQMKALQKRVKELEKALADTQVDAVLNKAFYQIVCREHGIEEPDEYKKKLDTQL